MNDEFLKLEEVSVSLAGVQIIEQLYLTIRRGEQWVITGPSGGGKTVLAHTLMGKHFYTGRIGYYLNGTGSEKPVEGVESRGGMGKNAGAGRRTEPDMPLTVLEPGGAGTGGKIAIVEQQHRFRNRAGTTELYYQQRFNSSDANQTITVEEELSVYSGSGGPVDRKALVEGKSREWLESLHIIPLLSRPLIQLSNGENKRVQLAIALLGEPEFLILDNPFLGLDMEGRSTLHAIINMLAAKGIQILLITGAGEFPAAITHVARLDHGGWSFRGPVDSWRAAGEEESRAHAAIAPRLHLDPDVLNKLRIWSAAGQEVFSFAVRMMNVTVRYGEKVLLEGINWEVRKGERWGLSGPNGAGKSTILSLITGDNPQAYANEIWLFDRRRGSGESIWDIKRKIGFVSPELHLYFDFGANCFDVIASGLFDTIGLFRVLSAEQEEITLLWMKLLSLEGLRNKRLALLSTGQQRMVLLARALIKTPTLLILDEPCQGLDGDQTAEFRELIGLLCGAFDTTLIYVSHYRQEIPDCVSLYLKLDNGRQV